MTGLQNRIALVTGASRGLGYAVARALGAAGAHVVALARTVGALEELDDEIRTARGIADPQADSAATLVPLDVTDDPALERLGAAMHQRWGRLDLWVHAALHAPALSPAGHIDIKDFDRALAVNLRATQRLIRVLDPLLRLSDRGRAVFLTDETGAGQRFHAAYRASKQGQIEIARTWAREVEATPALRVVFAAPPPMPTALRARFYPGEPRDRLADPAEVAAMLLTELAAGGTEIDLRVRSDGPLGCS